MKKLIFLTIFFFSLFFIGCSKEEKETITPEAPTIDEATPGNPSEKKINVKFIADEKEFEVKVNENTKVEKTDDPVKEGYIFSGWFTDLKFQEEYDFNNIINGDITLYAKFIKQASSVEVIEAKYNYAIVNGMGIMCWAYTQDTNDSYINTIYNVSVKN